MDPLQQQPIVLGVSGSIACYKAVDLASRLVKAGALVDVVMTASATQFVTPLCFKSITHRPVVDTLWDPHAELAIEHVGLAKRAGAILIAPATANLIAKLSLGLAEDALQTTVLDTRAPVIIAPAMEADMYEAVTTQEHLARLRARGVTIIEPEAGRLASGLTGRGRLANLETILGTLRTVLAQTGDLAGKHLVISAGGTQEPIDPVRIITNRSSGKMGFALAEAARDRGAQVTLIATPTTDALAPPYGTTVVAVGSVLEMFAAVQTATATADALIMAAAVSDYRVAHPAEQKIKKRDATAQGLTIELVANPDILAETQGDFLKVGFAAESEDLLANATQKLHKKNLDLIVANDITGAGSGFGSDTNRVILLGRDAEPEQLPVLPKREVADRILDRLITLFAAQKQ